MEFTVNELLLIRSLISTLLESVEESGKGSESLLEEVPNLKVIASKLEEQIHIKLDSSLKSGNFEEIMDVFKSMSNRKNR